LPQVELALEQVRYEAKRRPSGSGRASACRHRSSFPAGEVVASDNPEKKFTLQMLGAVAEYEHAKIIERTTRGRLSKCLGPKCFNEDREGTGELLCIRRLPT